MGVIEIGWVELAAATGFILVSGSLAFWFRLGITKPLAIATARTYLQLLALGIALRWIFEVQTVWLVLAILLLMLSTAVHTVLSRLTERGRPIWLGTVGGVFLSGLVVPIAVTALLIHIDPWYQARVFLPIAGMVIGNTMNGIALCQERLLESFRSRREEVLLRLSLGATAWEASFPLVRESFRAGMIPTMNGMATVGLVFIPGMMTGQVLAGVDPATAAKYQIVVMLMLSAGTALGTMVALRLSYRQAFDREEHLLL